VNASLGARAAESDIGLLLDFRVQRVECLGNIVVESTGLSVVLTSNRDYGANLLGINMAHTGALCGAGIQTRSITHSLFCGLRFVLLVLQRESIDRVVPRLVTPISTEIFSLLSLFVFSKTRVVIFPSDTAAKEIPIDVTINGNRAAHAPKDPTTLTDHPHVCLTHVVRDMEHHLLYILIIID
jgi:hypothetical protein